jgi:hypothetical protein
MLGSSLEPNRLLVSAREGNRPREDAALIELAKTYWIDVTDKDWLRTLCLCLAIEHKPGFHKAAGGYLMSIFSGGTAGFGLMGWKAMVKIPPRRGAPSKKLKQREREQAVLIEANKLRQGRPLTAPAVARILHTSKWIIPGDRKPLSRKVLTALLRSAQRQQRQHQILLADLLMNPPENRLTNGPFGLGLGSIVPGTLDAPDTPEKSG